MTAAKTWVQDHLGVRLVDEGTATPGQVPLGDMVSLALRRNPRRAHLLVSDVLGKHVPVAPAAVLAAGARLAQAIRQAPGGDDVAYVLGYAETATALGHCVAASLGAPCLHSTRRQVGALVSAAGFDEEHSHATGHHLLPEDPQFLAREGVVVLVDDEISTGRTALNTIGALQQSWPRARYVLAGLADVRGPADRAAFAAAAAALGVRVDVVASSVGHVELPVGVEAAAAALAARVDEPDVARVPARPRIVRAWPQGVRDGARHGFAGSDDAAARVAAADTAAVLALAVLGPRVLVLGCEELMYGPLLIADALHRRLGTDRDVRFSSTTRSPVVVVDEPGYPIRTRLCFPSHDGPDDAPRFAYNVAPARGEQPFDDVVVVVDDPAERPELYDGLLAQVAAACERVHLVVVPSYAPAAIPA